MLRAFIGSLAGLKTCLSFILHLIALVFMFVLGLRGMDVSTPIVGVLMSYAGTQAAKQISAHRAASQDKTAITQTAIDSVNDR
jgi:hypothetical protein